MEADSHFVDLFIYLFTIHIASIFLLLLLTSSKESRNTLNDTTIVSLKVDLMLLPSQQMGITIPKWFSDYLRIGNSIISLFYNNLFPLSVSEAESFQKKHKG